MRSPDSLVWRSLREAVAALVAALTALASVMVIDPEVGPSVLAVVLALSMSRSHLDRDWRGQLEALLVLPLVGVSCLGVGALLLAAPIAGAIVFVACMSGSIWLRQYGPAAARAGSLIALPFVALLVTPYEPSRRLGSLLAQLMPLIVALISLAAVTVVHWLGRRLGCLPPLTARHAAPSAADTAKAREDSPRLPASTRMALQMAVALSTAFVIGFVVFPGHWSWVVLTAFIVNSGNRGRGDVAYKSILRVAGAGVGTLLAMLSMQHLATSDSTAVALMLLAVFFGIWLRPLGYAWWALFVTLALAMLQCFDGGEVKLVLLPRMLEIVIGASIGVAAAWFVLPIRSTAVLRLRIAHALAELSAALDPAISRRNADAFVSAMKRVDEVMPPFRARRLMMRRFPALQPADWVDTLTVCLRPAIAIIESGRAPKGLRSEVGSARKALRNPAEILAVLKSLQVLVNEPAQ